MTRETLAPVLRVQGYRCRDCLVEVMNASIPPAFRVFLGVAEVLAEIGLTLPGVTRILPRLCLEMARPEGLEPSTPGLEGCVPVSEVACVSIGCEVCRADVPRAAGSA
jgi:hypothetical protein